MRRIRDQEEKEEGGFSHVFPILTDLLVSLLSGGAMAMIVGGNF
jgi:hypothetical protein